MLKNSALFLLTFFAFACLVAAAPAQTAADKPVQQTLAIIKPNAVKAHNIGAILSVYEKNGMQIKNLRMLNLSKEQAQRFYAVHKERPFFNDLVSFMTSGPVVAIALESPDAINLNRQLMGATDPAKASADTIRAKFGESLTANAIHGSDSEATAKEEVDFFFGSHPKA